MAVHRYADLTWEDMRDLRTASSVAILPVGALEAHGPHLPLGTDVIIAEAMATAGAARLAAAGREVVVLPALAYTAAPFAEGFPGTLSLPKETVAQLIAGIAGGLAQAGVSCLAIANAHFDPEHLAALALAMAQVAERGVGMRVVHPNLTRRELAGRLTEEFQSGACHAGRYETSIVMAAAPSQVRGDRCQDLPEVPVSLSEAIRSGTRSFEEAGGARAYFGDPATASAEEGQGTIDVLGQILAEAILDDTP
jgi:creatinine amidohydrolase